MNQSNATFEQSMARLEQIVRAMERGDVPRQLRIPKPGKARALILPQRARRLRNELHERKPVSPQHRAGGG